MLTFEGARAEAQWRWGSLLSRGFARYDANRRLPYQVGTKWFGASRLRGEGASWEQAFRDAAQRSNTGRATPVAAGAKR
jgi:hypothetical protein